jgi:cytoskeletal protein CcmA (bactofilin family)
MLKSTDSRNTVGNKDGGLTCVIAEGTVIEGKFTCSENVRLDGRIIGDIQIEKRLVMGETGTIDGKIHSDNAVVMGKIKGNIFTKNTLHLQQSAFIDGNIVADKMIVDEGATYFGDCKIGSNKRQ